MRVHLIQDSRGRIIAMIPSGASEFRTTLPGVPVPRKTRKKKSYR